MANLDYTVWKQDLARRDAVLSGLSNEGLRYLHFLMRRSTIIPHEFSAYPDLVPEADKVAVNSLLDVNTHNGSPIRYGQLCADLQMRLLFVLINKL